jgi:hypothetical protein
VENHGLFLVEEFKMASEDRAYLEGWIVDMLGHRKWSCN